MISIKISKLYFLPLFFLALATQALDAKRPTTKGKKQTITVTTNNPEIECTIEFMSKLEAKEIFGSTDSVNGSPKDTFHTVTNTNYIVSNPIFGLQTANAQSTSTSVITNGFSNLHNRYLVGKVTIKNNSRKCITISNPLLSGEEYISLQGMDLTSPEEILQRYITPSLLARIGCYSGAGLLGMLSVAALFNSNEPLGSRLFVSGFFGLGAYGFIRKIKEMNQHIKAKKDFKDEKTMIDGEKLEDNDSEISIPAKSTFTDLIFINKATYKNAEVDIENAEPELIFESTK